jgi:hypothetical protein
MLGAVGLPAEMAAATRFMRRCEFVSEVQHHFKGAVGPFQVPRKPSQQNRALSKILQFLISLRPVNVACASAYID